ncbi:MAG: hypothetical protein ACYDAI_00065 [Trichloromonadaceae bacterium]
MLRTGMIKWFLAGGGVLLCGWLIGRVSRKNQTLRLVIKEGAPIDGRGARRCPEKTATFYSGYLPSKSTADPINHPRQRPVDPAKANQTSAQKQLPTFSDQ